MTICRLYVAELETPRHYYVGTTLRIPYERDQEHRDRTHGSVWTRKHGYKGMLICDEVHPGHATTLENDMTKFLMAEYGHGRVRGGNYLHESYIPWQFKRGSPADVLKLRTGTVSKFGAEFSRLVDRFRAVRSLENPNHLYSNALA